MEIPIQVAVRIYPHAITQPKNEHIRTQTKTQQKKDANGNDENNVNNNNITVETSVVVEQQLEGEQQLDNRQNEANYCVQAIPIPVTTPGFLGGQPPPTALPGGGQLDSIAAGLIQVGPHSFPVTHALCNECTQSQVYHQTVFPLISLFMEGFDASVVTYGQRGTGKSYTLYGHGFNCVYGEADQGIVQRCVREIFAHITNQPERTYAVNVGFVEICGEAIHDLLGMGNIHCNSVTEVFHWLQLGLNAKSDATAPASSTHTLFTLTLEQQWISKDGLIQHRLSTASFSDLCATERQYILNAQEQPTSVPSNAGLHMLEQVVSTLTEPSLMYRVNGNIPYAQTTLTTLLKDSFGGRAQTLLILCVSPLEQDMSETICNLQFAFKVQCVRNYVIMNTFSDDNTPISPEVVHAEMSVGGVNGIAGVTGNVDNNFGLQFAASQWFKLVSNAEGLFAKLISSTALSKLEKEQIEEWLFLKQECEECLSSSEVLRTQKQLGPIQEADEPEESISEPETSCQQNSDQETDTESQRPDLSEKLEILMEEFRCKTDNLIKEKHKEFLAKQPKAVMESQESFKQCVPQKESPELDMQKEKLDERKASMGGRRRSIQPGASLSSAEIAMLNRVATQQQESQLHAEDFLDSSSGDGLQTAGPVGHLRAAANSPIENVQKRLRKLDADIEARQRQIKEIEQTMQLKQNIITELVKNSETRSNAKQRFNKKKAKLESEYEKAKKHMAKALMQGKEKTELERLRVLIAHIEQRLEDLTSMKHIAGESGQKVRKLQQSLHESKKQMEELQKKLKKERKLREQLDAELKTLKESKALVKVEPGNNGKQLKEVQDRISHLDHILREKSENLEQCGTLEGAGSAEQKEGLRHEIRNLRRTRDHLLEQRYTLDRKLKRDKMLTQREERKLLECDEAIEAIDAAIEFKNELICGHKSIDTSDRVQREKGEQMLMARLNKLSSEEMRTLLYKYFTKVIDLRDSSRKLEIQLVQLERERDAWEWKERVLSNAVRQARLEGERNAVLLQRQHEMKLTLMLRHLAEETSASSTSFSERETRSLALAHHQTTQQTHTNVTNTAAAHEYDYELNLYKAHKMFKTPTGTGNGTTNTTTVPAVGHKAINDMEVCSINADDALNKYKPLEKYKEKERTGKNLFSKFQVLTRYAAAAAAAAATTTTAIATTTTTTTTTTTAAAAAAAATTTTTAITTTDETSSLLEATMGATAIATANVTTGTTAKKITKHKDDLMAIPQENLKRLMAAPSATKVTRQKNKIIIQDATRKN